MRIALVADVFPPLRSSGAVQLRDLVAEFVRQGHDVTVMTPAHDLDEPWQLEQQDGYEILRLRAPRTKDVGFVRRTLAEITMPLAMLRNLCRSPLWNTRWDGVIWYSPSIFLGPVAARLKRTSRCRSYLIIRDIFPEWAVDMGLMGRGLPYAFFKTVERYQYSVADAIGVQSDTNLPYFSQWADQPGRRVEVLQNWLAQAPNLGCSIDLAKSSLAGRKLFVYAGNMGVAQGLGSLIELAARFSARRDVGFVFVGRGTEAQKLRNMAQSLGLENVLFYDEIEPHEVAGLYAQCQIGLVALDPRHKTHNVPGKFLSYMQAGLPVLATINPGNDMETLINNRAVGRATTVHSVDTIYPLAESLLDEVDHDLDLPLRCRALAAQLFAPEIAASQIVNALRD